MRILKLHARNIFSLTVFLFCVNCRTSYTIVYPKMYMKVDINYLEHSKTRVETDSINTKVYYDKFNLYKVINDSETTFYIDDKSVFTNVKESKKCYQEEIFKNNFLLLSKHSCRAPGPSYIERDEMVIINLNSHKKYKLDLEKYHLLPNWEVIEKWESSKNNVSIVNIDLENQKIRLKNLDGLVSFKLTEF